MQNIRLWTIEVTSKNFGLPLELSEIPDFQRMDWIERQQQELQRQERERRRPRPSKG